MDQGIIKSLKDHYRSTKKEAEQDMFYRCENYKPVSGAQKAGLVFRRKQLGVTGERWICDFY
ncbi:hypothetical protein L916_10081 [Phytophthora nicotianae]|uniref:Uncharacterized protein n=1 Tax=Phytophthora nicotianae TaxID=4792 RepID=W2IY55_PHYNI|nr:hypothetical protein L916_10081 [Phytophthora nicotianae]